MKKQYMYTYVGKNGITTIPILLPDSYHITKCRLVADEGKVLTDGTHKLHWTIVPEEEIDQWIEVDE